MKLIAGVDIGNSTTEVCIGSVEAGQGVKFLASTSCPTTGTKGTVANIYAIKSALKGAMSKIGREISDLSLMQVPYMMWWGSQIPISATCLPKSAVPCRN